MRGSNIVSAIHNLKMAQEYIDDFIRSKPNSLGAKIFTNYRNKIEWIFKDLITNTLLDRVLVEAIKNEINSDVFTVPAITEKVSLLNPEQREIIEATIDAMLNGEDVKIVDLQDEVKS